MKFKIWFSLVLAVVSLFLVSCIQDAEDQYDIIDYQTDEESYYKEYQDEDVVSDDPKSEQSWDVTFQFLCTINDGNTAPADMNFGQGLLIYRDLEGNRISVNYASWVIKKSITLNSGVEIPILQVFFTDDPGSVDDDGRVLYWVLQLEGSSLAKSETYFLNNDKLYKTKVKLAEDNSIAEICYLQEPESSQGKVTLYTSNIRIGEELRLDGYANMNTLETPECKKMN